MLVSQIVHEQILSCLKTGKKISKIKKRGKKSEAGAITQVKQQKFLLNYSDLKASECLA